MNRFALLVVLASMASIPSSAAARQRPDFAGEWALADSADRGSVASQGNATFRVGSMGSGWGSPIAITQQAGRVTIEYAFFSAYDLQPPIRLVYALDGSESSNTVMIGHASSLQRSRAAWQGDTLVITTRVPVVDTGEPSPRFAELRQAFSLESPDRMVVETTRVGILAAATTTTRTTYIRRSR